VRQADYLVGKKKKNEVERSLQENGRGGRRWVSQKMGKENSKGDLAIDRRQEVLFIERISTARSLARATRSGVRSGGTDQ